LQGFSTFLSNEFKVQPSYLGFRLTNNPNGQENITWKIVLSCKILSSLLLITSYLYVQLHSDLQVIRVNLTVMFTFSKRSKFEYLFCSTAPPLALS
jgi:hypothetical protein